MRQSCNISCRVFTGILHNATSFVLARGHEGLSIEEHLDKWLFLGVESEDQLIKSRGNADDATLILLPQEVVRTSVDGLYFPRYLVLVIEVSRFPDPTADAILST